MAKKIKDYMKDKEETKNVQVELAVSLVNKTWKKLKKDGRSMKELIEASLLKYLDE